MMKNVIHVENVPQKLASQERKNGSDRSQPWYIILPQKDSPSAIQKRGSGG
jgi:hypothetical protein